MQGIVPLLVFAAAGCITPSEPARTGGEEIQSGVFPLYRRVERADRTEVQSLWPIFHHQEGPERVSTKVVPFFWYGKLDVAGHVDEDWGLLPLFLGGTDTEEGSYFACIPLGGSLKGMLHKEEIYFVLFPAYAYSREGGFRSWYVLWPLISWGGGDGRRHHRAIPFYSWEEREGESWRASVLWPFFSWGEYKLDKQHPVRHFLFFPFYGRKDSDLFWSRTYLWPLFTFGGGTDGYNQQTILWPIFVRSEVPGKERQVRVWPLFGHKRKGREQVDYYLWPFVWDVSRQEGLRGFKESFWIAPFWFDTRHYDLDGNDRGAEVQLWPLVRRRRAEDGSTETQVLSLIPFLGWQEWEANYDWLWTVWRTRYMADGGRSLTTLFGLFTWDENGTDRSIQLAKGLFGYERGDEGSAIRLLWLIRFPI